MSTVTARRPLAEAAALAQQLADDLVASGERIAVAGSIRRRKPVPSDIEILVIPKQVRQFDLFGEPTNQTVNLLEERVAWLMECGELAPRLDVNGRPRLGPKYKALVFRGMNVDLFLVTPETWGVQLVLRTGPADFSHRLVMHRSESLPNGRPGLLPAHLRVRDGRLWGSDGQPLETPEETDVFRALGLAYIAPEARR
jgi:DNA polymerase/3'-5' exonuclease PolX